MIARLIAWSARNPMLVLIATAFAVVGGVWALRTLPLDAIPDLSDTQVIVYTEFPGQAPQVVEDQVTYPLTTAMLTVPRSKVVRGFSFFGVSFVYVIFEDGTDIYWARSRVLEYLNAAGKRLPAGVTPTLGPDATGVGWVYQYAVVAKNKSLAELRSLQDWEIRFGLAKAEGVAEVASVGGFVKQYNVVIDPGRMRSLGIPLSKVREVIRQNNMDVGGRTVELAEHEFMVRGRGYIKSIADLERIVVKVNGGTPVLLKDIARVELGPGRAARHRRAQRRRRSRQRHCPAALRCQRAQRHHQHQGAVGGDRSLLPKGVEVVPVYDRSELIYRAIETLRRTLFEESLVVALVCIVFLLHVRSALVAIVMLPVGVLMSFMAMKLLGPRLQHHEPRRHRHRHRRHDRRRHRHDRERAQASGARAARQAPPGNPRRSGVRGRPRAVLLAAHHHGVVPADLHAGSAGRTPVRAAGLHQDVRHGGGRGAVDHAGAGADGAVRARPHHPRAQEPGEPVPHRHSIGRSSGWCCRPRP